LPAPPFPASMVNRSDVREMSMLLRTFGFALTAGFALTIATQAPAQDDMAGQYQQRPVAYGDAAQAPAPWYLDPEEIGPLYAIDGDTTRAYYTYAGDEDASDFADRYGCRPVWDGGVNRYVPACNAH
jgi:hypothetical protein